MKPQRLPSPPSDKNTPQVPSQFEDNAKPLLATQGLLSILVKSQPTFMLLLGLSVLFVTSLWFMLDVWLILFASVLVAIFMLSLVDLLKNTPVVGTYFTRLPHGVSVAIVGILLAGLLSALSVMFGNELIAQLSGIKKSLPEAVNTLEQYSLRIPLVNTYVIDNQVFTSVEGDKIASINAFFASHFSLTPNLLSGILGGLTNFLVIILVGLFFAMSPQIYARGFIRLITPQYRNRGTYLLSRSYIALQHWLLGQFVVMSFVGVSTAIGLYLMDIPFAFALGFIAFALDFVPVLGPWIAAAPLLLVVLITSPDMIMWAIVLVIVVQQLESYVISPLVQHKLVSLPPVALLLSQMIMATMSGFLGIALATPLIVLMIVWVQILYIKFVLGDYQILIMGQSDSELKDDPFNALKKGEIYADDMHMQLVDDIEKTDKALDGHSLPTKIKELSKTKNPDA